MKTKYIIIILLVLFILVNIFINKDTFISFNKSAGFDKTLTTDTPKIFKNIFKINTEEKIDEADILEQEPKLTFYSYEKCPKLYKLFKGLSSKEDNQIENVDGLRFRNKIRSAFYNIDRTIKIEHPILNLERKLMPVTIKGTIKTKLNDKITTDITIDITSYLDYFGPIYSAVDNYQKLIDDCKLISLYLENRIPKKISENFIRLTDILEGEQKKVKDLKDIDPKALFLKDLENNTLPDTNTYRDTYIGDAYSTDNKDYKTGALFVAISDIHNKINYTCDILTNHPFQYSNTIEKIKPYSNIDFDYIVINTSHIQNHKEINDSLTEIKDDLFAIYSYINRNLNPGNVYGPYNFNFSLYSNTQNLLVNLKTLIKSLNSVVYDTKDILTIIYTLKDTITSIKTTFELDKNYIGGLTVKDEKYKLSQVKVASIIGNDAFRKKENRIYTKINKRLVSITNANFQINSYFVTLKTLITKNIIDKIEENKETIKNDISLKSITVLNDTIDTLDFDKNEKEYLIKIQDRIKDYKDNDYSKLVNDIITLESLDQKKNKDFCAMLLLYVYYNINVPKSGLYTEEKINKEIDETKKILEDYKIDDLKPEYKVEDKIVIKIESIKDELKKIKTDEKDNPKLILDNPNFIFELGGKKINYFTDNHIEQKHKQVSFNVKTDFTEDDVVNFVEYCFNLCCFGAIDIDLLAFTSNHYRVLPCFNPKHIENSNKHYYILPERIRKVAMEEGKEYTRAKCNGCASNIIIFFDKLPDKFKYYEAIKGEPDIVNNGINEPEFINDILPQ